MRGGASKVLVVGIPKQNKKWDDDLEVDDHDACDEK